MDIRSMSFDSDKNQPPQPKPNRAQRRARERQQKGVQRRGTKAYHRAQAEQRKEREAAQRKLVREGVGFYGIHFEETVFCVEGHFLDEDGGHCPVVAVNGNDRDRTIFYDNTDGRGKKALLSQFEDGGFFQPVDIDLDDFKTGA